MEQVSLAIGIIIGISTIIGTVFKVWLFNPLSGAINRLNVSLDRLQIAFDKMDEKNEETRERVVILERDVKSLHFRIDNIMQEVAIIKQQQIECLRERSDHHA